MPEEVGSPARDPVRRKVFLSYARSDRERVNAVRMLLELGGADVFMDWRSIEPGTEWERALTQALTNCDVLCVFWSAAARRSKWVVTEYTTFINQYPERTCVPLRADGTPLPALLAKRQAPPEFLALTNELFALRQHLIETGVGRGEARRIVRRRLAESGLALNVRQINRLLGVFATGLSMGALLTSIPKLSKLPGFIVGLGVAACFVAWRACSTEVRSPPQTQHSNRAIVHPARRGSATIVLPPPVSTVGGSETESGPCGGEHATDPQCGQSRRAAPSDAGMQPPRSGQPAIRLQSFITDEWFLGWRKLHQASIAAGLGTEGWHRVSFLEGKYHDIEFIKLTVADAACPIHFDRLHIRFEDKSGISSALQYETDVKTIVIPIPSPGKSILNIDLDYHSHVIFGGCPQFEIWARESEAQIHQLTDSDPGVRTAAARALARMRSPNAVAALAMALTRDVDAGVRGAAAAALSTTDEQTERWARDEGVRVLTMAAESDSDLEVRSTALASLRRMGRPQRTLGDSPAGAADLFVSIEDTAVAGRFEDLASQTTDLIDKAFRDFGYSTRRVRRASMASYELAGRHAHAFIISSVLELRAATCAMRISARGLGLAAWTPAGHFAGVSEAGSAQVIGDPATRQMATSVCVSAVTSDVIRRILPQLAFATNGPPGR